MIKELRMAIIASLGVKMLSDVTFFLEETDIPKDEWPQIIVDSMIYVLQRGELKINKPLIEMIRLAAEQNLEMRKMS
jgi:hypothetical protein